MRLLNIETGQLRVFYSNPPPYVCCSHRWQDEEEISFQEYTQGLNKKKKGYNKIEHFCIAAKKLVFSSPELEIKLEWLWIDTCCIDKTNSVELQEALNSMFRWYAESAICLAYLYDVTSLRNTPDDVYNSFQKSIYWKRGWTLQELLAPKLVLFYNYGWEVLGRKNSPMRTTPMFSAKAIGLRIINDWIVRCTNIPINVLNDFSAAEQASIEVKSSWMNGRETTRVEDQVYCQLGIFGVFMPLIYGEGEHAKLRLEDAIELKQRRALRVRKVTVDFYESDKNNKFSHTETFQLKADNTVGDLRKKIGKALNARGAFPYEDFLLGPREANGSRRNALRDDQMLDSLESIDSLPLNYHYQSLI